MGQPGAIIIGGQIQASCTPRLRTVHVSDLSCQGPAFASSHPSSYSGRQARLDIETGFRCCRQGGGPHSRSRELPGAHACSNAVQPASVRHCSLPSSYSGRQARLAQLATGTHEQQCSSTAALEAHLTAPHNERTSSLQRSRPNSGDVCDYVALQNLRLQTQADKARADTARAAALLQARPCASQGTSSDGDVASLAASQPRSALDRWRMERQQRPRVEEAHQRFQAEMLQGKLSACKHMLQTKRVRPDCIK
jgi:hypothetical protein